MSAEEKKSPSGELNEDETQVLFPLEIIDKSIGHKIHVLMSNDREYKGTLIGFDDFVNIVLENVQELDSDGPKEKQVKRMLLNGSHITMIVPTLA
ncbi:uncharacterized protein PRCAT00001544001 [Priceomyces carsonii]|uniref:uncharacterized protein n=1 Tax=Priceomyces carsonii TaxID=28549 RepID=UPI002ED897BB|nr:unnamed protein product [Priceomyces carsonii]